MHSENLALVLSGVNTYYGDSHILQDVSFTVAKGSILALLGRNGAGKTTLIKLMLGMISADKGDILFKGENLLDIGHSYYQNVSAVLESVDNVYPFLINKLKVVKKHFFCSLCLIFFIILFLIYK